MPAPVGRKGDAQCPTGLSHRPLGASERAQTVAVELGHAGQAHHDERRPDIAGSGVQTGFYSLLDGHRWGPGDECPLNLEYARGAKLSFANTHELGGRPTSEAEPAHPL